MSYSIQYYDLVLVGIVASLAVGVAVGVATPLSLTAAVPLFALVSVAIIGHGLFVNGPVDDVEDLAEEVDPEEVPAVATAAQMVE